MMRRVTVAVAAALIGAGSAAAQDHDMSKGMGMDMKMMETPWREMNGFHSLLHLGHQALMKSGDLAPAKRNAGLMADAAEAWAKSAAPAECHAPEGSGEKVTALAVEARAFASLAEAKAGDPGIKEALNKLHDQFQALHMICMPMGMDDKKMDHKKMDHKKMEPMEPKKPPR